MTRPMKLGLKFGIAALAMLVGLGQAPSVAQQPKGGPDPRMNQLLSLGKKGPMTASIGGQSKIEVPAGYLFIPKSNMQAFNRVFGNMTAPSEQGALFSIEDGWFVIFEYDAIGYIKDEEKGKLGDAAAILKARQDGQEAANPELKKMGQRELEVTGWQTPPYFDNDLKCVAWGIKIRDKNGGGENANFECHVLGRHGDTKVILVVDLEDMDSAVQKLKGLLTKFEYNPGEKYSDFREGDKVAEYGLYALAAGGGLAVLAKTGILAKLIKPILIGLVVVGGLFAKFFKSIFGRKDTAA